MLVAVEDGEVLWVVGDNQSGGRRGLRGVVTHPISQATLHEPQDSFRQALAGPRGAGLLSPVL